MKKIEILKIKNPNDFWIADKNSKEFINLIHENIKLERFDPVNNHLDIDCLNGLKNVCVFDTKSKNWYRARVIEKINSFGFSECLNCLLIDSGETVLVPKTDCKPINNQKLRELPQLAKHCSLFGLKPKANLDWIPSSTQFFLNICKNESSDVYAIYKKTTNENSLHQLKIYLKLNDSNNNNQLVCLNDLLIENKFASISKSKIFDKNGHNLYIDSEETTNLNTAELNEKFNNFNDLKMYLNSRSRNQESVKPIHKINSTESQQSKIEDELKKKFNSIQFESNLKQTSIISSKISTETLNINTDVLLHNVDVVPIRNIDNKRIHRSVRDYLTLHGFINVNDFEAYFWPAVLRGLHVLGMSENFNSNFKNLIPQNDDESKKSSLSYICPLLSLLLEKADILQNQASKSKYESGYIKQSLAQVSCQNGPVLLIVCASCENAQRTFEIINDIIEIASKANRRDMLKALLIQGGGYEHQYDVPLANGVDILIAATPFCLLKAVGSSRTNLERLKYMVFDEAYLLMEKFPRQIKTLMSHYSNLLKINDAQPVAQFILISNYWSTKLRSFMDSYLLKPAVISTNKLESSFYGQTHHVLKDYKTQIEKLNQMQKIIFSNSKNTVIFTNSFEKAIMIKEYFRSEHNLKVDCLTRQSKLTEMKIVEDKWFEFDQKDKFLILIIEQEIIDYLNINSAKCIINFDFPQSKTAFAKRLWYMKKYFSVKKQSIDVSDKEVLNQTDDDNFKIELNNEYQIVDNNDERLCSYMFISKSVKEYSESFYNFLIRIGYKNTDFPEQFLNMVQSSQKSKEDKKIDAPLCPYLKSFGTCMNVNKTNCLYKHRPNKHTDRVRYLHRNFTIPNEGYIKFKISFIKDTNNFFINLLAYQGLNEEQEIIYDKFTNLDLEMQLYYSNPDNIGYINDFIIDDIFAYKDTTSSIYKRIKIIEVIKKDGKVAHELLVKCIDYGSQYLIPSKDLIHLPFKFKDLPPQAIEVYICDVRPIEKDLNWSTQSKLYMAEKLLKSKEFVGKIQLAAGETLWLDPISSYLHLKTINLLVCEDSIRYDLISNNYGVYYPKHIKELRELFSKNGLHVPKLEDELLKIKKDSQDFYEIFYDLNNNSEFDFKPDYAYLLKDSNELNKVYLTTVESPDKFYLQLSKTNNVLKNLNTDINLFINRIEELNIKKQAKIKSDFDDEEMDDILKNDLDYLNRCEQARAKFSQKIFKYLTNVNSANLLCLARSSKYNEVNRARIVDYLDDNKIKVFYVDYGDYDIVYLNDIFPILTKFIRLLPFQAIECSLENLKPISLDSNSNPIWSKEANECFVSMSRDSNDYFYDLIAYVIDQIEVENDQKKYSIKLYQEQMPVNIDLSFKLVALKHAILKTDDEMKLFNEPISSSIPLMSTLSKKFIDLFVHNSNTKSQSDHLILLELRSNVLRNLNFDELKSSGLLQTWSKGLFFINDPKDLMDFILNLIQELLQSNELKLKILQTENYLRAFWILINDFKYSNQLIIKVIKILRTLTDSFETSTLFSDLLIKFIKKLLDKVRSDLNFDDYDEFILLYNEFRSKKEQTELNDEQENQEEIDQDEVDKIKRVQEFIISTSELNKESMPMCEYEANFNFDSEDEELEEIFLKEWSDIFKQMDILQQNKNQQDVSTQPVKIDYKYPKILWNQTKDEIILKIKVKSAKECKIDYNKSFLSFRCEMNGVKYGYDFNFFAEIDVNGVNSLQEENYFRICLKKNIKANWIRLLSILNKPSFIKSEFNNVDTNSSEDDEDEESKLIKEKEKNQYLFKEFLNNTRNPNETRIISNFVREKDSSTESDSDSDFDDFNTDVKELNDYKWD